MPTSPRTVVLLGSAGEITRSSARDRSRRSCSDAIQRNAPSASRFSGTSVHFWISSSAHASTSASTSCTLHGRSRTTPSVSGGSGSGSGTHQACLLEQRTQRCYADECLRVHVRLTGALHVRNRVVDEQAALRWDAEPRGHGTERLRIRLRQPQSSGVEHHVELE